MKVITYPCPDFYKDLAGESSIAHRATSDIYMYILLYSTLPTRDNQNLMANAVIKQASQASSYIFIEKSVDIKQINV